MQKLQQRLQEQIEGKKGLMRTEAAALGLQEVVDEVAKVVARKLTLAVVNELTSLILKQIAKEISKITTKQAAKQGGKSATKKICKEEHSF